MDKNKKIKYMLVISNIFIVIAIIIIWFLSYQLQNLSTKIQLLEQENKTLMISLNKLKEKITKQETNWNFYLQQPYPDYPTLNNIESYIQDFLNKQNELFNNFQMHLIPNTEENYFYLQKQLIINWEKVNIKLKIYNDTIEWHIYSDNKIILKQLKDELKTNWAKITSSNPNSFYFKANKNIKNILKTLDLNIK